MMLDNETLDKYILSNEEKRHRNDRGFAIKEERPGCLTVRLSSAVIHKLGLVAGLDYCYEAVDGNRVILSFYRKGDSGDVI